MTQAAQHVTHEQQLGFFGGIADPMSTGLRRLAVVARRCAPVCAGCRAREARYGFRRHDDDPATERPRTLCFDCFRAELAYRQDVNARLARGWNASQVPLPLEATLNALTRRRRRAQIAARRALGV